MLDVVFLEGLRAGYNPAFSKEDQDLTNALSNGPKWFAGKTLKTTTCREAGKQYVTHMVRLLYWMLAGHLSENSLDPHFSEEWIYDP